MRTEQLAAAEKGGGVLERNEGGPRLIGWRKKVVKMPTPPPTTYILVLGSLHLAEGIISYRKGRSEQVIGLFAFHILGISKSVVLTCSQASDGLLFPCLSLSYWK